MSSFVSNRSDAVRIATFLKSRTVNHTPFQTTPFTRSKACTVLSRYLGGLGTRLCAVVSVEVPLSRGSWLCGSETLCFYGTSAPAPSRAWPLLQGKLTRVCEGHSNTPPGAIAKRQIELHRKFRKFTACCSVHPCTTKRSCKNNVGRRDGGRGRAAGDAWLFVFRAWLGDLGTQFCL